MNPYQNRVLFTVAGALIFVVGRWVPLPGVDQHRLLEFLPFSEVKDFGAYNRELAASGVFSLGVKPFVMASALILVLAGVVSRLRQLRDAPRDAGAALDRPIYAATLGLAFVQGWALAIFLELIPNAVLPAPSLFFRIQTTVILMTGAAFVAWLASQITRRGLVNGIAVIVFVSLLATAVSGLRTELAALMQGLVPLRPAVYFLILIGGLFWLSVYMVRAEHRIPLQHVEDSSWAGAEAGTVPSIVLRPNMVGVVPIMLAGIAMLPLNYLVLHAGSVTSWALYCVLIVVFTYLATAVSFSGADVVAQIRRYGLTLPETGRPDEWEDQIDRTVERLVAGHAVFLVGIVLVGPLVVVPLGIPTGLSWLAGPSTLIIAAIGVAIIDNIRLLRQEGWVAVFEADTELEAELACSRLDKAGIPARQISNRVIPITGTLAFWEMSRPPYPGLTIYRRLGGGGVYTEVPHAHAQRAKDALAREADSRRG